MLDTSARPSNRARVAHVDPPEVRSRFEAELGLVDAIVRQLCRALGDFLSHDELVSFGQEGLLDAARRYDPDRGIPFRRFAQYRIRGAVLDGMRRHADLPRRTHEKVRALRAATAVADGLSEDTAAAVAAGLHGAAADQRLADHLANLATAMAVGLGATFAKGDDGDLVNVDEDETPEESLERSELMLLVRTELDRLPDVEATLIRRHVLGDESLDKVSADLGLSKSWGSRLLARGMSTLSRRMHAAA